MQCSRDKHEWNDPSSAALYIRHRVRAVTASDMLHVWYSRKRVIIRVLFPERGVNGKGMLFQPRQVSG